ncbi:MAG: oxidoreductase [Chloroflexi bacterium]|nr:oxidoreductase [Chloroflexota bacterium]|tara:strand:- start:590 stop:2905 length:2316 start_codon:yes stop_codon:yes gene_type:complete
MSVFEPNVVLSKIEYDVVGKRPIRHDGVDKVTGRAKYGADINMAGLLHGKILRSPHAHARIKSINTKKAELLPGVYAVAISSDFPYVSDKVVDIGEGELRNIGFLSANCLARDKVLYKGHAVAAVAASSPHIADAAVKLIEVDYEVLKPVLTAEDAMKEGAPILHDLLMTTTEAQGPGGTVDSKEITNTNVGKSFEFRIGDIQEGFSKADIVIEESFSTVPVHQGYIEPHSATAYWDPSGRVTIWSSSQGQFTVRDQTAKVLDLPVSSIKAIPLEIGGGFGGKLVVYLEPVAVILSKKSGRPVKITMSRSEVFSGSGPTCAGNVWVKMGATTEGKFVAAEAKVVFGAGAFPGSPVAGAARCMFSPYNIPNGKVEAFDVVTNMPKVTAYRAPGAPIGAYAVEQVVDMIARRIEMDPIEIRKINASHEGTQQITGPSFGPVGFLETLDAAESHPHYQSKLDGPFCGRGIASGFWGNNGGPSSAIASVHSDGKISLIEGSPDIGGTRTVAAMHVAEVLGIPVENINPSVGDTDSIGYTSQTGGSSVAYKTGWSSYEAAQDVKKKMIERAAIMWGINTEQVTYDKGILYHSSDPELKMTFNEVAEKMLSTGGSVVGNASTNHRRHAPAFATHICDVEVDPDTGKVTILRYTTIQDVGKAIHPSYVEGQLQGGAAQGIGWALNEEYFVNPDGEMVNGTFLDYRMPISLDLPFMDTVIVEVPHDGHPYGVRGVAECALVPPLAAVANAVADAIDSRLTSLPMNPGAILDAISSNGSA